LKRNSYASAMTEEQSGIDGVSQLTEFLTQRVNDQNKR
jgi:hypothetical protein